MRDANEIWRNNIYTVMRDANESWRNNIYTVMTDANRKPEKITQQWHSHVETHIWFLHGCLPWTHCVLN